MRVLLTECLNYFCVYLWRMERISNFIHIYLSFLVWFCEHEFKKKLKLQRASKAIKQNLSLIEFSYFSSAFIRKVKMCINTTFYNMWHPLSKIWMYIISDESAFYHYIFCHRFPCVIKSNQHSMEPSNFTVRIITEKHLVQKGVSRFFYPHLKFVPLLHSLEAFHCICGNVSMYKRCFRVHSMCLNFLFNFSMRNIFSLI